VLAQLGAVEHQDVGIEVALLDAVERGPHDPDRGYGQPRQDQHQDEAEDQREYGEDHHGIVAAGPDCAVPPPSRASSASSQRGHPKVDRCVL
jgi:hypothetical protein